MLILGKTSKPQTVRLLNVIQLHRICAIPSSSISTLLVIDSTQ